MPATRRPGIGTAAAPAVVPANESVAKPRELPEQLPSLVAFSMVARHLNFTRAAAEYGITPTAMSRTIRALEEQLNTRLFHRTTRTVALTEAGAQLLAQLEPALGQIRASVEALALSTGRVAGTLRITMSGVAFTTLLLPRIAAFSAEYPAVVLEVATGGRMGDVVASGCDVGICLGASAHKDLIGLRVGPIQEFVLVASPHYLDRHPPPSTLADLTRHACIRERLDDGALRPWRFKLREPIESAAVDGTLVVSEMTGVLEAAMAGLGVGYVLRAIAQPFIDRRQLVPVLGSLALAPASFHLHYPNRSQMPAKLRVFIDFLQRSP